MSKRGTEDGRSEQGMMTAVQGITIGVACEAWCSGSFAAFTMADLQAPRFQWSVTTFGQQDKTKKPGECPGLRVG